MTTDNERKTTAVKSKLKATKSISTKVGHAPIRLRSTTGKPARVQHTRDLDLRSRRKKAELEAKLEARKELSAADASARGMANWLRDEAFTIACETQQIHESTLAVEQQFKELSKGLGVPSGRHS